MSVPPPEIRSRAPLFAFLAILLGVGYVVSRMAQPFLLALFLGATLAALAQPLYRGAMRTGLGPRLAAAAVTFAVAVLLLAPAALFTAQAVRQAIALGEKLSAQGELNVARTLDLIDRVPGLRRWTGDPEAIRAEVADAVRSSAGNITHGVVRLARGVPEALLHLALTVLALYYFLVDGRRFVDWMLSRSALDPDVRERVVRSLHGTAIATVWSSLAAAAVQSLMLFIGYAAFGVPAAFLAAGAAFILSWIPMVGTVPVSVAGLAYLYTQGAIGRMIGLAALVAAGSVLEHVVRPWVLRGREGMHPFVALLAIFGGVAVFGLFGVFIGPILAALFISLFDVWPTLAARSRKG